MARRVGAELVRSLGTEHTCALRATMRNVVCFGSDLSGQLGNGGTLTAPKITAPGAAFSRVASALQGAMYTTENNAADVNFTGAGSSDAGCGRG